MKKCDCYYLYKAKRYTHHPITGQRLTHDIEKGICNGTKERDECSCGGDRTKCDFYPEVREKAGDRIGEDNLIVTYDYCSPDAPTLCIARKEKDKVRVLNIIHGEKALYTYALLTGHAEWKDLND